MKFKRQRTRLHHLCLVSIALLVPFCASAQRAWAEARVGATEWIIGQIAQSNGHTTLEESGAIWNFERDADKSDSLGRGSVVVDPFALRVGLRATANARSYPQASLTTAFSDLKAALEDQITATSPAVTSSVQALARVRFRIESDKSAGSNMPDRRASGRFRVYSVDAYNPVWNETFTLADLPQGEHVINMPIVLSPASNPEESFFKFEVHLRADSEGTPSVARSLRVTLIVTWLGIDFIELADGTRIETYQVSNAEGSDYNQARPRPDLHLGIERNIQNPNQVRIQWAGSEGIRYQLESNSLLRSSGWSSLGNSRVGNGTNAVTDPLPESGSRYYRIRDATLP